MSQGLPAGRSAGEVLEHHLQAFADGDLDAMLSDYATDVVMFTPRGVLRGHAAIRPIFAAILADFRHPQASFQLVHSAAEGAVAYMVWTATTADKIHEMGTDTMIVEQGLIVAQTYAGKITPRQ
jgi:ketosteroid isomerase-like protein